MSEQNKAMVRRMIDEVWNGGNLAVVDELVSPDYVGHDPSYPSTIEGTEGFKQWVGMARGLFPDFNIVIDELIAEGDSVAGRISMSGTHEGEIMGPPTGKHVTFTGMFLRRLVDGKFIQGWDQADAMGMFAQLGLLTAPGG